MRRPAPGCSRRPSSRTSAPGSSLTTSDPTGPGYPGGRAAGEVPIEAAILAAADAYEAMTARRSYRAPLDPQAASEELRRGAGMQFDARVVDALLRVV
ncbi:MAG: HD domain-containing phosphohydrolase [Thermoleophilaceae bacterium]